MKFQSVFILFNIILVLFIAIVCFFPTLILGADRTGFFWRISWFLPVFLVIILVVFDIFFLVNRRLYSLLEKEDWPALVHFLEDKVLRQGRYSNAAVRLLANTYLVLSDSPAVMSLENKAAIAKPSLVDDNALVFGTARILGRDITGAIRFFESRINTAKPDLRQWVQWYYAFALLLDRRFERAQEEFSRLARISEDGVVAGLSAFFLGNTIGKSLPEMKFVCESSAAEGKDRVLKVLPQRKDWEKEVEKIKTEVHAAVLSKYITEAEVWLYGLPEETALSTEAVKEINGDF